MFASKCSIVCYVVKCLTHRYVQLVYDIKSILQNILLLGPVLSVCVQLFLVMLLFSLRTFALFL